MALPIVFAPGLNCNADLFYDQIKYAQRDRFVAVANHRRFDSMAAMAEALLQDAPPRFVMAGLSMGGYLSFEVLRQAPERVAALVLVDTTARPDSAEASERRERLILVAESGRFDEIAALQMPSLLAPSRLDDPELTSLVRRMATETGADAFVRQQRAIMSRVDSRPLLAQIRCPTLLVFGDQDQLTPLEHGQEMAEAIPGARLCLMPMCGHLATIERPAAATHALASFLEEIETPS